MTMYLGCARRMQYLRFADVEEGSGAADMALGRWGTPKSHSLSSCYLSDSHFWGIPVGHISGHAHRNLPGLSVNEGVDKYPVSMLEINFVTWQCFASPSMLNVQELSHAL